MNNEINIDSKIKKYFYIENDLNNQLLIDFIKYICIFYII